jgi:hypothetical protein
MQLSYVKSKQWINVDTTGSQTITVSYEEVNVTTTVTVNRW